MNEIITIAGVSYPLELAVKAYAFIGACAGLAYMVGETLWGTRPLGVSQVVYAGRTVVIGLILGVFWLPLSLLAGLVAICVIMAGA